MVHLKSLYPQPPPVPDLNIHQGLFNAPGQADLPNYLVQVDISTGRERRWFEFRDLVYDGMTALAAPASAGGLGLDPAKDIVGIFSHNCLVRPSLKCATSEDKISDVNRTSGLHHTGELATGYHGPIRDAFCVLDSIRAQTCDAHGESNCAVRRSWPAPQSSRGGKRGRTP